MRVGVDTYAFHRMLGQPRPGETPAAGRIADGGPAAIAAIRALGCEVASLQTCFLGPPERLDVAALREAAGELELILAWGHPEGLAFGGRPAAARDLRSWIEVAAALGTRTLRIVVGGPALRGREPLATQLERTIPPLRAAAAHAAEHGLAIAIENHGDLTTAELVELLARADHEALGVCFDTANALRLGEDVVAAAQRVAPLTRLVHLKDVEPLSRARNPVAGPCSTRFGEGVVPLEETLAALAAPIAAGAPVCVELGQLAPEADEPALLEQCVAWLNARRAPSTRRPS